MRYGFFRLTKSWDSKTRPIVGIFMLFWYLICTSCVVCRPIFEITRLNMHNINARLMYTLLLNIFRNVSSVTIVNCLFIISIITSSINNQTKTLTVKFLLLSIILFDQNKAIVNYSNFINSIITDDKIRV